MGGVFTLQAIVFALIIIMCLMAFAVNYSKAFRVKNEIRSIIEKHEGLTVSYDDKGVSASDEIDDLLFNYQYFLSDKYDSACKKLGYDIYVGKNNTRFCIKCEYANNMGELNVNESGYRGAYYSIVTFVNIDVPIVNNLIPFTAEFLKVSGETALIYSNNHNKMYCKDTQSK